MACELLAFLTAAAISAAPVLGPGPAGGGGWAGGAGGTAKQWLDGQIGAFTAERTASSPYQALLGGLGRR